MAAEKDPYPMTALVSFACYALTVLCIVGGLLGIVLGVVGQRLDAATAGIVVLPLSIIWAALAEAIKMIRDLAMNSHKQLELGNQSLDALQRMSHAIRSKLPAPPPTSTPEEDAAIAAMGELAAIPLAGTEPIRVTCSHCGSSLKLPAGTAAKIGRCPKCHEKIELVKG